MYTKSISGGIMLALSLAVVLVSPAVAQESIGNDVPKSSFEFANPESEAFENLSSVIHEIQQTEYLPLEAPALTSIGWNEFGNRLETALASDHRGLRNSALRLVIAYGKNFDLSESAIFDIMRTYRDGDSERVRRMAVVALAQIDSDWALKFLERSVRFEKSDQIKHTFRAVLHKKGVQQFSI